MARRTKELREWEARPASPELKTPSFPSKGSARANDILNCPAPARPPRALACARSACSRGPSSPRKPPGPPLGVASAGRGSARPGPHAPMPAPAHARAPRAIIERIWQIAENPPCPAPGRVSSVRPLCALVRPRVVRPRLVRKSSALSPPLCAHPPAFLLNCAPLVRPSGALSLCALERGFLVRPSRGKKGGGTRPPILFNRPYGMQGADHGMRGLALRGCRRVCDAESRCPWWAGDRWGQSGRAHAGCLATPGRRANALSAISERVRGCMSCAIGGWSDRSFAAGRSPRERVSLLRLPSLGLRAGRRPRLARGHTGAA
jgi:hypothetical protein